MDETIKTLIVEDDAINRKLLELLLEKYCPEIEVIGVATTSLEFIDLQFKKNPDLLLLDIHLGENKNTLDVLSEIKDFTSEIIIISSDESYAVKAINQYRVAGYITKPIEVLDFKRIINNAIEAVRLKKTNKNSALGLSENLIALSTSKNIDFIRVKDILYLEADGKYTVFHLTDGKDKVVSKNLGEYEKILSGQIFFRIHHKYIVNLQKVVNINRADGSYCHLTNGKSLSIAKRRHESLRKFLHL